MPMLIEFHIIPFKTKREREKSQAANKQKVFFLNMFAGSWVAIAAAVHAQIINYLLHIRALSSAITRHNKSLKYHNMAIRSERESKITSSQAIWMEKIE